jgi:hypothetical protein
MTIIHPGTIQANVGEALRMIRVNIEQQDVAGIWNFTQHLETLVCVYLDGEKALAKELRDLPNPMTLNEAEAFENLNARQRICLRVLFRKKLYGYPETEVGTSKALYGEIEVEA